MLKAICFLFLASLALTNVHAQSDCHALMRALMPKKQSNNLEELRRYAKALSLDQQLIDELAHSWDAGIAELPKAQAENWLLYVMTLAPENQLPAMQMMATISSDSNEKLVKRFKKIEKRIEKKYESFLTQNIERLKKKNPSRPMSEIRALAETKTQLHMKSYRRLSFECRSQVMNDTRKKAASSFKRFTIGIGIASSFAGMAYANRDNEIEDWIGQFGYETVVGVITGSIASKIITNPRNSEISRALKKYFFSRATGLVDMGLFSLIFGADQDEAQARLDEVLGDKDKAAKLRELQQIFESKKLYHQVREKFVAGLSRLKEKIGLEQAPPIDLGVDWGALTSEDLAREDVQDVLLAAAIMDLYAEGEGSLIATGNVGADRYAFHAAYGAIMLPKDMATSMWIYNILCLGMSNPKTALIKATAVFAINRVIFDQLYYAVRRGAINQ